MSHQTKSSGTKLRHQRSHHDGKATRRTSRRVPPRREFRVPVDRRFKPAGGFLTWARPSRSILCCPFWDFLDFPGIVPFCPFPLSWPLKSTCKEHSRKGPGHKQDLPPKMGNPSQNLLWRRPRHQDSTFLGEFLVKKGVQFSSLSFLCSLNSLVLPSCLARFTGCILKMAKIWRGRWQNYLPLAPRDALAQWLFASP